MSAWDVMPDDADPGWKDVKYDTKTLDCMGGDHRYCRLAKFCECTCHQEDTDA